MKLPMIFYILFLLLNSPTLNLNAQDFNINIQYSNLSSTYHFVQKLSNYYPDNPYKEIFSASPYNTVEYQILISQLDTLNLFHSISYEGYPYGQKAPLQTISLIEKHLCNSNTLESFARDAYGIVANDEFYSLIKILQVFEPIYTELIYDPNKDQFDNKINELTEYVKANNISRFFNIGLNFYGANWLQAIPIDITIIPSLSTGGFTATAFMNNAISEVPLDFKHNDILFSVLMHEIYHLQFDGKPLDQKKKINSWFLNHSSPTSQYAYLLFDEALATALGNGYVYEQLNSTLDPQDWYNVKYINLMAKKIYPLVKNYIENKKSIDQNFIDQYIELYDDYFSSWLNELDHLFTYRYILTDDRKYSSYFRRKFRYAGKSVRSVMIDTESLNKMAQTPITKVIIVSNKNREKLNLIKTSFNELSSWKFNAEEEFIYTKFLDDKTSLFIINIIESSIEELFDSQFIDKIKN